MNNHLKHVWYFIYDQYGFNFDYFLDVIKDNFEASEAESNVPSFMAIQHVRDQLLPISKR